MSDSKYKHRFFSDFYDSVFQRSYWNLIDNDSLSRFRYLGKLRLDAILSHTIVLTDSQVLDGAFFLHQKSGPSFIMNNLSRSESLNPVIEVRARASRIEDSLLMLVKKPENLTIRPFSFSGIRDIIQRAEVSKLLAHTPYDKVNSWKDILNIFKIAEVEKANIDLLYDSWSKWIEFQNKGIITIIKWETERGFPREFYAGTVEDFTEPFQTEEVKTFATWLHSHLKKRSTIDARIEQLRHTLESDKAKRELRILESRYHRIYNQAASWQHRCGSFESSTSTLIEMLDVKTDESESESQDNTEKGKKLDFSVGINGVDRFFLYKLGTMPVGKYEELFWTHSDNISNWWYHRDTNSLRRVIESVTKEISKIQSPDNDSTPENFYSDVLKVFMDAAIEFIQSTIKPIYVLLAGLVDIHIKYFSGKSKNPKKRLIQRIIDLAKERNNEDEKQN